MYAGSNGQKLTGGWTRAQPSGAARVSLLLSTSNDCRARVRVSFIAPNGA